MIPISIIHVLVICSATVSGSYNSRHYTLITKTMTQDVIGEYLRNSYEVLGKTSLECARLCHERGQCTGMLACPDVCYLLGVVGMPNVKNLDYGKCDAFVVVSRKVCLAV